MRRLVLPVLALLTIAVPARADAPPCGEERAAWTKEANLATATALGQCAIGAGRFGEAAQVLAPFQTASKIPTPEEARAQKLYADAAAKVLVLKIEVDVLDADVAIDGASVGKSPLPGPMYVAPGAHTIVVTAKGYAPVQHGVAGGGGETRTVPMRVVPVRRDVVGYDLPTTEPAPQGRTKSRAILVVGYSAAGIAFAATAVLAVLAIGKSASADDTRKAIVAGGGNSATCASPGAFATQCATLHDQLHSRDSLANAAVGTFLVGGAILGATIAYALWPTGKKRDVWEPSIARVRTEPLIGRGMGGLVVTGAF